MRGLSDSFFECLKSGFLSGITESVKGDPDLNLEIRDNYIIVYYKGNSLLMLSETGSSQYKADINKKFMEGMSFSSFFTESNIDQFLSSIGYCCELAMYSIFVVLKNNIGFGVSERTNTISLQSTIEIP